MKAVTEVYDDVWRQTCDSYCIAQKVDLSCACVVELIASLLLYPDISCYIKKHPSHAHQS
jgi:hypothetical protein